jgi:hypothetical protein
MSNELDLAFATRHAGQQRNLDANTRAHRDDRSRVETVVAGLARSGRPFTADHVHEQLEEPYDHNVVSSVMGVWAQTGKLAEYDRRATASVQRTRRASRNRWWTGTTIPQGGAA